MLAVMTGLPPWPVFPLPHGEKKPRIKWRDAATTDAATIARWLREQPGSNWGAAMGPTAGVWGLDLDGADGKAAFQELVDRHGPVPRGPMQRTGGGGRQLFFAWPSDRNVRNYQATKARQAGKIGSCIDVRGDGGFVVIPPSIHPSGNPYIWFPGRSPGECPAPPAPRWLLDLVAPPPKPQTKPAIKLEDLRGERYTRAAFRAAVEHVATAPAGDRNNTLNAEAWSLARHVRAGKLDYEAWYNVFYRAGVGSGLDPIEVERTLRSAWQAQGDG